MILLNKILYSLNLKKKKKFIEINTSKFSNKKIIINFLINFYKLDFKNLLFFSKIKKKKKIIFFTKYNFYFKNKNISLYLNFLTQNNKIVHYNSIFLKLIELFSSEINSNLWKYPYDDDPSEILFLSGYFSSKKTKFSLKNARNKTYERIYLKGWFI